MTQAILKFCLNYPLFEVFMPVEARVLSAHAQGDDIYVWALVNLEAPVKQQRLFNVYGTGNPIQSDPGIFIGTVMLDGGSLVFHVFERVGS